MAWKEQAVSKLLWVALVMVLCGRKHSKEMCGAPGSVHRNVVCVRQR